MTRIEELGLKDIELIQHMAKECYLIAYKNIHSDEQNLYMLDMMYSTDSLVRQMTKEGSQFFSIYNDGTPVGYCAIKPYNGNEHGEGSDFEGKDDRELPTVYLDKLYVLPEEKGKGHGRKLLEHIIKVMKDRIVGNFHIRLDVNKDNNAIDFYKHLGFKEVDNWTANIGNGYYMYAITMERLGIDNSID